MQSATSSRLTRNQGKKIARQSLGMIVFAILAVLVFIFILMPKLIGLFFNFIGTGDLSFKEEDTVPPQIPVVLPLPESTKEDQLLVEGYAEAKTKVIILNNSEKVGEVTVDDEGAFEYELILVNGDNSLSFYGIDEAENESTVTTPFTIVQDKEAPTLELENLTNGQEILSKSNQNYVIKGKTEPRAKLSVNERSIYVNADGGFQSNYFLAEGDNELKFVMEDRAGNKAEQIITVKFRY
ncbi:MAG: hypothetical protein IT416_03080 [Candidatus Pacebacteria bacterium]|nr:hypothetical protein [Candidatus Paceibacterota bacterium]